MQFVAYVGDGKTVYLLLTLQIEAYLECHSSFTNLQGHMLFSYLMHCGGPAHVRVLYDLEIRHTALITHYSITLSSLLYISLRVAVSYSNRYLVNIDLTEG